MSPRLFVALVAALNLLAGASFGFAFGRASVERFSIEGAGAAPGEHDVDVVKLVDVLDLPPAKASEVRAVLASVKPRCDALLKDVRPKLQALHEEFLHELEEHLTPAQIARLVDEYHRELARPHSSPGGR